MENNNDNINRIIGRLEGKVDLMVGSINKLASSFESLEAGRLSRLEIKVAENVTDTRNQSRSTATWTSAIVSVIVSVVSAVVIFILIGNK